MSSLCVVELKDGAEEKISVKELEEIEAALEEIAEQKKLNIEKEELKELKEEIEEYKEVSNLYYTSSGDLGGCTLLFTSTTHYITAAKYWRASIRRAYQLKRAAQY